MKLCKCGNKLKPRGKGFRNKCSSCLNKPWHRHKKDRCDLCGFVPVWMGQLDVDHIDGDKKNNKPSNLQTLCANCHRLKTHLQKDYMN